MVIAKVRGAGWQAEASKPGPKFARKAHGRPDLSRQAASPRPACRGAFRRSGFRRPGVRNRRGSRPARSFRPPDGGSPRHRRRDTARGGELVVGDGDDDAGAVPGHGPLDLGFGRIEGGDAARRHRGRRSRGRTDRRQAARSRPAYRRRRRRRGRGRTVPPSTISSTRGMVGQAPRQRRASWWRRSARGRAGWRGRSRRWSCRRR